MTRPVTFIVSKTFEVVTPESVEHGEAESRGFVFEREHFSLEELIDLIEREGFCHPSSEPITGSRDWLTTDAIQDRAFFERAEERRLSLHLVNMLDSKGSPIPPALQDTVWKQLLTRNLGRELASEEDIELSL